MTQIDDEALVAFMHSLQRLLQAQCTEADVRRTMASASGFDAALWQALADLGVLGLLVPEAHGGLDAGPAVMARVLEETGAALLCGPLWSSSVLSVGLLRALGDQAANARLLPGLADGSQRATVALTGPQAGWLPEQVAVQAQRVGGTWLLHGQAAFVTHAQQATVLLVVARAPDGLAVFELDPGAAGVQIQPLPSFDHTLRLADVALQSAKAQRVQAQGPVWPAVQSALDAVLVALAAEQAGGTRRVLNMTVAYAQDRYQFGRAIGSFQAIKHMAADLLQEAESCTSAARHAAQCLADDPASAGRAVSLAAFACADAYVHTAATSIQMHGGIAFTWDHPAHLYLRRARALAQLFGSPDWHRERYVQHLEGLPA